MNFIAATLTSGNGRWVAGIPGAAAQFQRRHHEETDVVITGHSASASSLRGAIAFDLPPRVRALEFALNEAGASFVVLAVPRYTVANDVKRGMTFEGPDCAAVEAACRVDLLFDFGLGSVAGRYGLRVRDPDLIGALNGCIGQEWPRFAQTLRNDILRAAPTEVIRNPIGRIEVFPSPSRIVEAPHQERRLHFQPQYLAMEHVLSQVDDTTDSYLPCAVHHPDN